MRCLKAFGERIAARGPDHQTAEIQIRDALMNRWPDAERGRGNFASGQIDATTPRQCRTPCAIPINVDNFQKPAP